MHITSDDGRNEEREKVELDLLLEGIYRLYGYDLRNYNRSFIRRRVWHHIRSRGLDTITALLARVLHDPSSMKELYTSIMINVTSMFRDPDLFTAFRKQVVPLLQTYPFIRIWHAGCATGEEVISTAILLWEEGLYGKSQIYATDISEKALKQARQRIFPLRNMQEYTRNYLRSGGTRQFSDYYQASGDSVTFAPFLTERVVFSEHNLATDRSFNEFHVIFCRNVMIYFDNELQARVYDLIYQSLSLKGFLILGDKESIRFTNHEDCYKSWTPKEKLYCKIK